MNRAAAICFLLLLCCLTLTCAKTNHEPLFIFAAASLSGPLDSLASRYMAEGGPPVLISYGASGTLAQQIRVGADVDMFISADTSWLQKLTADHDTPILKWEPFLRNRLVLVTSSRLDAQTRDFGLPLDSDAIGKIAIADPEAAPAGRYARAYLERIGIYDTVGPKLIIQEDVRAVVNAVLLEVADVGFVYASDVALTPSLRIVNEIPDSLHPPIVYGLAILRSPRAKDAERFGDYLMGSEGDRAFEKAGFMVEK